MLKLLFVCLFASVNHFLTAAASPGLFFLAENIQIWFAQYSFFSHCNTTGGRALCICFVIIKADTLILINYIERDVGGRMKTVLLLTSIAQLMYTARFANCTKVPLLCRHEQNRRLAIIKDLIEIRQKIVTGKNGEWREA